jgi:hypothetical protein
MKGYKDFRNSLGFWKSKIGFPKEKSKPFYRGLTPVSNSQQLFSSFFLNAKDSAMILFTLLNSSTLRICTAHLPDRNIPLEWRRALYYKNLARILSYRERSGHVPGPFHRVLLLSPRKL